MFKLSTSSDYLTPEDGLGFQVRYETVQRTVLLSIRISQGLLFYDLMCRYGEVDDSIRPEQWSRTVAGHPRLN